MSQSKFNFVVTEGGRLDVVLAKALNISRSQVSKYIEDGVLVNSKVVTKASFKVEENDVIECTITKKEEENKIVKSDIPLNIVYEDEYYIVVNKERGMTVHPSFGHYDDTLVNALAFMNFYDDSDDTEDLLRPGIVHRIDKDTSGLLIVAKTSDAKLKMADLIAKHEVKREYLALIEGIPPYSKFTINVPLLKSNPSTHKVIVDSKNGKEAISHFEVVASNNNFTLLKCSLETGRTHQIRVHLSYYDMPIVNDPLYNNKFKKCKNSDKEKGQLLHAYKLSFIHPFTNKEVTCKVDIDDYFRTYIDRYKIDFDFNNL